MISLATRTCTGQGSEPDPLYKNKTTLLNDEYTPVPLINGIHFSWCLPLPLGACLYLDKICTICPSTQDAHHVDTQFIQSEITEKLATLNSVQRFAVYGKHRHEYNVTGMSSLSASHSLAYTFTHMTSSASIDLLSWEGESWRIGTFVLDL